MPTTTLNYDIVIYGGTFAGVAAAWKAASYIKANGGGKRIAVIIPDVSGMLGGIGTAGRQNFVDIWPSSGDYKGAFHGGTFGHIFNNVLEKEQYYSIDDMATTLKNIIIDQNKDSQGNPLNPPIIDLFPDLIDEYTPTGTGYDIYNVSKNPVSGKIESVDIKAISRDDNDGFIKYDNFLSSYTLTADIFIDASDDGKLTSISGVGPSIGRQDWPEEYLPISDERCYEYSSRQQAASLLFKVKIHNLTGHSKGTLECKMNWYLNPVTGEKFKCSDEIAYYNDDHPSNDYSLKPWNAARNGNNTNEWWFNALLVYNVDGRAHERDRGTALFPSDMRPDYHTTDQAWVGARNYILQNKSDIEAAIKDSITRTGSHPISCDSVEICMNGSWPIVAPALYLRETVHTTINPFNNFHGSEMDESVDPITGQSTFSSNYAVSPNENILSESVNPYGDSANWAHSIGLTNYNSDINAYQRSDLKLSSGEDIWGECITKKLRPDLVERFGWQKHYNNPSWGTRPVVNPQPLHPVAMPYEVLITQRVPNLLIPGTACCVSSFTWSEVRLIPNLTVLGDAAGVAAGYGVMNNDNNVSQFSESSISSIRLFLKNHENAILSKEEVLNND